MHMRFIFFVFLFLASQIIPADEATDKACKPVISASPRENIIIVRPHENAFLVCTLTQSQLHDLISVFLRAPENQQMEFRSIFLGRLVDHPWLSKYLAQHALADAKWDRKKGRPVAGIGYINHFVRDVLSTPELLGLVQEPFTDNGYTVVGASVEKVLVTKASDIDWLEINDPALVPYDALIHFTLAKP